MTASGMACETHQRDSLRRMGMQGKRKISDNEKKSVQSAGTPSQSISISNIFLFSTKQLSTFLLAKRIILSALSRRLKGRLPTLTKK